MKYNDSKNKIEKTTSQTSPAPEAKAPERVGFFRRIQLYISNQTSERRANTPKQGEPGYRIFVARRIVAISLPVLVIMLAISISVWSNIMFSNLGSADGVIEPDEYDLAYENMEPEEEIVEIAENDLLDVTSVQTTINEETLRLLRENQMKQVTNVLLIGVDRRGSKGNSRADTLMVASIDKLNNKLKLTSIMRDTLVPIEGHNQNKINAACAFGGVEL
ncbi:MAG: LCP family protein, partial [Christensenellales bacterium]